MSEIGRELKVSDLRTGGIVVLLKPGRPAANVRVVGVGVGWVTFKAQYKDGKEIHFLAQRCGPDNEMIRDEDMAMHIYEYLGT